MIFLKGQLVMLSQICRFAYTNPQAVQIEFVNGNTITLDAEESQIVMNQLGAFQQQLQSQHNRVQPAQFPGVRQG